jgi:hypothetical protein
MVFCGKRDDWCCRRVDPGDAVEMCVQGWWWRRGCEVRRLRSVERRRSICGATGGRQRGEDAHPGVVMEEGFRGAPPVPAVETHGEEVGHRRTWCRVAIHGVVGI